ncbi:RNA-directed DNA polymerase [Gaopeijia maritima]|uniref:RNA-directed DNA polymerase n=1 Tax=Gaopeijia maritima TaxID=3119007 RepID=A0ABU9E7A5_9BACT
MHLPKPSGLQRPITLLGVEDQIVLQSVANVFAQKLGTRRRALEGDTVFSNLLQEPDDGIFFVQDWRRSYWGFQDQCETLFSRGLTWIAHFDIAAFYDTISHSQLLARIAPRGGNQEATNRISGWFGRWSTIDGGARLGHGIPQGPIASDFLAECFLLPLDERMKEAGFHYLRYVDDIRIFAGSRIEAQKAALELERVCRAMGLSPQGKKFRIHEADSLEEALGELPSLAPPDHFDGSTPGLDRETAEETFRDSLDGRPLRIVDKSKAKYVLYRSPPSEKMVRWVVALLPRHPEHIDGFVHYLSNHARRKSVVETATSMLREGVPFEYVRGELWHVVARMANRHELAALRDLALQDLRAASDSVAKEWGVLHFLVRCDEEGLGRVRGRIKAASSLTKSFLAPRLPDAYYGSDALVREFLTSQDPHPAMALAQELPSRGLTHRSFAIRPRQLHYAAANALRELGVIASPGVRRGDQVQILLTERFGVAPESIWRSLLAGDYSHLLSVLRQADALRNSHRSAWLNYINSFNDGVLRAFLRFLDNKGLPGGRSTTGRDGKLIKLGVLLDPNQAFTAARPQIATPFRACNDRRNTLPGSHPFDERGGAQNAYLQKSEYRDFLRDLGPAYDEIVAVVTAN